MCIRTYGVLRMVIGGMIPAKKHEKTRTGPTMVVCSMLARVGNVCSNGATRASCDGPSDGGCGCTSLGISGNFPMSITSVLGYILLLLAPQPLLLLVSTVLLRPRQSWPEAHLQEQ